MQKAVDEELPRKDGAVFAEIFAGVCRETGLLKEAEQYYLAAAQKYTLPQDKLRALLCRAYVQKEDKRPADAAASVSAIISEYGTTPYAAAVKKAEADLSIKKK